MNRRGGSGQLQAEIRNDDELKEFLENDGIVVLDVHPEWCGSCKIVLSALKKLKLEVGEILNLAEVNADTVTTFNRLKNRCEPTFMICSKQKIVRVVFGIDIPKLIKEIRDEIELEKLFKEGKYERTFYDLDAPTPAELERDADEIKLREEKERLEKEKSDRELQEKLDFLIREIQPHVNDNWVTLFLPHTANEYNKIMDPARNYGLMIKDKKICKLTPEMIRILNYSVVNPLDDAVLENIVNLEVAVILWIKNYYADPRPSLESARDLYELILSPPVPKTAPIPVEVRQSIRSIRSNYKIDEDYLDLKPLVIKLGAGSSEDKLSVNENVQNSETKISTSSRSPSKENLEKRDANEVKESENTLSIPPIWVPLNKEANALFMYVFFKKNMENFLPPEKVEEPEHNLVSFPANRYSEVMEMCEDFPADILASGFFTNNDPENCQLICKTKQKYDSLKRGEIKDKFLLKVSRKTSKGVLNLVHLEPDFVSMNNKEGKEECVKIFDEKFLLHNDFVEEESKEKRRKSRRIYNIARQTVTVKTPSEASSRSSKSSHTLRVINENSIETIVNLFPLEDP